MQKTCKCSGQQFEVSQADLDFLEKVSPVFAGKKYLISPPSLCPEERLRRRMIFRNELSLHLRKCDMTGERMVSMFAEDVPFPVYHWKKWFTDEWDARDHGREFDFSRPFFEQLQELRDSVPHMSLIFSSNVNCDFCNVVGNCKNCYMCSGTINSEDCYYGNPFNSKNCIDSLLLRDSELCLQCIDSTRLYDCQYCQDCHGSQNLMYCYNVRNSKNCFACVNLNRKEYCILNQQYSKEDYQKLVAQIDPETVWPKLEELKKTLPHRAIVGVSNENVQGDYMSNSKDCFECYHSDKCQDCRYCFQMMDCKDEMDVCNGEYGELCYEISGHYKLSTSSFCHFVWDGAHDLLYSLMCQTANNCFGSVGLRRGEYCVLNKTYSKAEYEELVPKIIAHMQETAEWGEFFPMTLSPFAYNETTANQYLPLSKEKVLELGLKWSDSIGAENREGVSGLKCEVTGKPYKIIDQERAYYEARNLSLPKRSPAQRHLDRIAKRNPMKLWDRKCDSCSTDVATSYSPERTESVYCEDCFANEVY